MDVWEIFRKYGNWYKGYDIDYLRKGKELNHGDKRTERRKNKNP